jgi:hypothetical protein
MLAVAAVLIVALQYTPIGLRLYAVGEFPEAARAFGLRVNRLVAGSYVASSLCRGIAAILSVAYLSGSTTDGHTNSPGGGASHCDDVGGGRLWLLVDTPKAFELERRLPAIVASGAKEDARREDGALARSREPMLSL